MFPFPCVLDRIFSGDLSRLLSLKHLPCYSSACPCGIPIFSVGEATLYLVGRCWIFSVSISLSPLSFCPAGFSSILRRWRPSCFPVPPKCFTPFSSEYQDSFAVRLQATQAACFRLSSLTLAAAAHL